MNENEIYGGSAVTPTLISDLAQTNPLRSDYVKGKHLVANSINCTASGNPIRLDDVSPLEHEMAVSVKSKNKFFATEDKTYTFGGLTETVKKGLSSFVLNGTATMDVSMQIASGVPLKAGTYTVSVFGTNVTKAGDTDRIYVAYTDASGATKYCNYVLDGSPKTFTIVNDQEVSVQFIFASGSVYENKEVSIQIEEGTTATAYAPFIPDITAVTLKKCGKNLLPYPYLIGSRTEKGITFTVNGDGTITANGTPTNYGGFFTEFARVNVKANTTYMLSGCPYVGGGGSVQLYVSGVASAYDQGKGITFTPSVDGEVKVHIAIQNGATANNLVFKPQIEVGTTATDFEPYHSKTYTADADGKVEGIIGNGEDITLMADSGAVISAEYNADTKKYIDKKFAELQALVLEV